MEQTVKQRITDIQHGIVPVGYQKTKSGIIPADWQEVCFGDILHNQVRKVAKPQTSYWRLGVRSHAKGTFREFVEDPTTVNMDELYSVQTNDLVVNITFAWEHAIAIVKEEDSGLLVSHRFPTYVFNENAAANFYKYIITQKWVKEQLDLICSGGAGRNRVMNKNAFLKIPCYAPTLEEQRRIAEILGCCDRVIALKKELIAEKKKQKKALMQKLLNPDSGFRLPGFFGKWRKTKMENVAPLQRGFDLPNSQLRHGEYPVVYSNGAMAFHNEFMVNAPGVVTGRSGTIGAVFYIEKNFWPHNTSLWVTNFFNNIPLFVYHLYQFIDIEKCASGSGVPTLNRNDVHKIEISIPCNRDEQQAIANILSAADKEIDLLEQEIAQQEQKKKSLMQLLLTGIVRV